jgi:uncharacterized damage-inducible protein DinB
VEKGRRATETRSGRTAAEIFAVNERVNQLLLERLEPAAWRAKPVGGVRTIAAIITHLHNVRAKWVRLNAPQVGVPVQLHWARCTQEEARVGLAESAARCEEMLALVAGGGVKEFLRDGWATAWPLGMAPVGVEMVCYMVAHEAHHRGQVCMLAHQMGFELPKDVMSAMWSWERLWGEG